MSARAERGTRQVYPRKMKNGVVVWYCRFVDLDGERKKRRLQALTKADAILELAQILARVRAGLPGIEPTAVPRASLTFRELAERYCGVGAALAGETVRDVKSLEMRPARAFEVGALPKNGKAAKAKRYRAEFWSVLKCHVLDVIGDTQASEVRRSDVVRVVDSMRGEKPRTTQKAVRHISRLYNWGAARELVDCPNPAHKIEMPKSVERNDHYTDDEVARILAKAAETAHELYPVVAFAYYTGARKGEIASLRWGDVDLVGARAVLSRSWKDDERKAGDSVTTHLAPRLLAILQAHHARAGAAGASGSALVFPDTNGRMRDTDDWGLRELVQAAQARRFLRPWHSFRHSHGTALGAAGASVQVIQQALGQRTMEMARRYTKVAAEQVRAAVHALPTLGPVPPKAARTNVTDLDAARRRLGTKEGPRGGRRAAK